MSRYPVAQQIGDGALIPTSTGRIRPDGPDGYGEKMHAIGQRIDPNGPNGCWLWTGPLNAGGYGPHRTVYRTLVGPVHRGMILHHTCFNKACCNPAHLEQVTRSEHGAIHGAARRATKSGPAAEAGPLS